MHLVFGRYRRSGYAPRWFYLALAAGFAALSAWAAVRGDWLVAAIGIAACAGAIAVMRLAGRLSAALAESRRGIEGGMHDG